AERRASGKDGHADLIALARRHDRLADPCIRRDIAQAIAWRRLNKWNAARAKRIAAAGGVSPLMSLGKLAMSRILHNDARVMRAIIGSSALCDGPEQADAQDANFRTLHAYMNSIGGGTDQIQRNIIAEKILGLPREIEIDRTIPFKDSLALAPRRS
ncbi:MAG: acyl-CoA dehydrogenase family protein, partial [Sphingopyxis sp.]